MHGRIGAPMGVLGESRRVGGLIGAILGLSACAWCAPAVHAETLTFGKTTVGASKQVLGSNRKRVNHYALPTVGTVSQLSVYLEPTSVAGQQLIQGVIYADSGGVPGALLASSSTLTFSSSEASAWYTLSLPATVELPAGNYWIGVLSGVTSRVAGYRYDKVAGARAYNRDVFTAGPSNPFGEAFTDSEQMSLYATYTPGSEAPEPVNTSPPTVSGNAQQGQALTEHNGSWSNSPTSFAYQWLQCTALGASCLPIAGATAQTYVPVAADVGHTLAVQETASNVAGPGEPALSAPTTVVVPPVPVNTAPPRITGTAQQGQTLTEQHGTWTNEPTSFAYQWQQCDGAGTNCRAIVGATGQTYALGLADVGHTIKVQETAKNAGGSSTPASSSATAPVASQGSTATFGKTSVGAVQDRGLFANYKIVHSATLSASGSVTKLSVYAIPGIHTPSPQSLKAVIYADSGGSPGALLATGTEVTYRGNVNGSGWLDLPLGAPVALTPGTYWLGVITGTETEGVGYVYDKVSGSRAYNANTYASGPANPFGAATKDSEQASVYATYMAASAPPENTGLPTISGTTQQGQVLTASPGTWTGSPTSYSYEWKRCDSAGNNCAAIALATASTYTLVEADVGKTVRVSVTATNGAGPSTGATSAATGLVTGTPPPPVSTSPPTISGTAQQGQTLTEHHGSWTNEPTGFTYQWQQCDSGGNNCANISGATQQEYPPVEGDVGHKLKVQETASNAGGPGSPAYSTATAVVTPGPATPVNTSPPTISGTAQQGQTLTEHNGTWTNTPTGYTYQWLQCDSFGNGCLPISGATKQEYVPVEGDVGHTLKAQETASNAGGPSSPAFSAATAVITAAPSPPVNTSLPTISGTAQQGQVLTATPGTWTGSPTGYAYEWKRCDSAGNKCAAIALATATTYTLVEADVGSTLRVTVVASNSAGPSAPATSAQSAVVIGSTSPVSHLEYVLQDGVTSVYDMDHEYKLLKTISLPQTKAEVRGVTVAPSTHLMFIPFGGDGGGSGTGSVLAYDLVQEKLVWEVKLSTGIDSGQVSPDGSKLYIPTGENSSSGIWNVLSASNGSLIGTIQGGAGPHNTVASNDGHYVYLGGRAHNFLDVYETATGKVKEIGPLVGTVRPLTVNGSNTLAFTTATNFDGFQISSITTGKVLSTVSFGEVPKEFPFTAPSHGISLSPDEKQLYVIDSVHKEVQFWDVSKVKEGIAPTQIGVVPVAGLSGKETPCTYDCGRGGWIQLSVDGRFLFAGDSGEVIETATRKVVTTIATLAQTKKSIEVDWQNGVPIATSGRTGVGFVP